MRDLDVKAMCKLSSRLKKDLHLRERNPTIFLEIHPLELKRYGHSVSPIVNRLLRIYDNVTMYEELDMSGLYKKGASLLRRDKPDAGNW
jgi:hypothetical protein